MKLPPETDLSTQVDPDLIWDEPEPYWACHLRHCEEINGCLHPFPCPYRVCLEYEYPVCKFYPEYHETVFVFGTPREQDPEPAERQEGASTPEKKPVWPRRRPDWTAVRGGHSMIFHRRLKDSTSRTAGHVWLKNLAQ